MDAKLALLFALGLFALYYVFALISGVRRGRADGKATTPTAAGLGTGAFTNFFDTLGIGSFAPTTAIFRAARMVPDEHIPGTLNVGHTLPAVAQAFIFTTIVAVGSKTLILMIAAAAAGAWLGAGVFSHWPRRKIQLGMGLALLAAASIMVYRAAIGDPAGGLALELTGMKLAAGVAGNFVLGILMTIGIGLYGPCMLLVSLLGMDPKAAFPIMMGSCAFLMPIASARFIKERAFDVKASLGLLIGGIPAVLIAAFLVREMSLTVVRVLVVVVVLYTAATLLHAALRGREAKSVAAPLTEGAA